MTEAPQTSPHVETANGVAPACRSFGSRPHRYSVDVIRETVKVHFPAGAVDVRPSDPPATSASGKPPGCLWSVRTPRSSLASRLNHHRGCTLRSPFSVARCLQRPRRSPPPHGHGFLLATRLRKASNSKKRTHISGDVLPRSRVSSKSSPGALCGSSGHGSSPNFSMCA